MMSHWQPYQNVLFYNRNYMAEAGVLLNRERTLAECDGIAQLLAFPPHATILDICCGHGRHLLEFARRAYQIAGVDSCAEYVSLIQQAARQEHLSVQVECIDISSARQRDRYEYAYCINNSFGHCTALTGAQAFVNGLARYLRPGGRMLLEIPNREWLLAHFQARTWREVDSAHVTLIERTFDPTTNAYCEERRRFFANGERERGYCHLTLYPLAQVRTLLQHAGIDVGAVYGDFLGAPQTAESPTIILVGEYKDEKGGDRHE